MFARKLLWSQLDPAQVPNPEAFERNVLQMAGGNPLALRELARQAAVQCAGHPNSPIVLSLSKDEGWQDLHHEAGIHYFDLTPLLLLLGAFAIIARFLALGLNDIEGYILAGSFGAVFLTSRYFLYRALRRNS